jgi:hypothetical protein
VVVVALRQIAAEQHRQLDGHREVVAAARTAVEVDEVGRVVALVVGAEGVAADHQVARALDRDRASELFNSEDGIHQFGGMINADASPAAVYDAVVAFDDQAVREAFTGMPCAAGAPSSGPQQAAAGGSAPRLLAGERWSRSAGS